MGNMTEKEARAVVQRQLIDGCKEIPAVCRADQNLAYVWIEALVAISRGFGQSLIWVPSDLVLEADADRLHHVHPAAPAERLEDVAITAVDAWQIVQAAQERYEAAQETHMWDTVQAVIEFARTVPPDSLGLREQLASMAGLIPTQWNTPITRHEEWSERAVMTILAVLSRRYLDSSPEAERVSELSKQLIALHEMEKIRCA